LDAHDLLAADRHLSLKHPRPQVRPYGSSEYPSYANAKLALKDRAIGKPCSATYRMAFKNPGVIETHIASFEAAKPVQFAGSERRSFPCRQSITWY
jgi:hypothetical protein